MSNLPPKGTDPVVVQKVAAGKYWDGELEDAAALSEWIISEFPDSEQACIAKLDLNRIDREKKARDPDLNTSGEGVSAILPAELRKWNWGAFFFTWIWGLFHRTYFPLVFTLLLIVFAVLGSPTVGLGSLSFHIGMGIFGNRIAWENKRWQSVSHFKEVQKRWALTSLIIVAIILSSILWARLWQSLSL